MLQPLHPPPPFAFRHCWCWCRQRVAWHCFHLRLTRQHNRAAHLTPLSTLSRPPQLEYCCRSTPGSISSSTGYRHQRLSTHGPEWALSPTRHAPAHSPASAGCCCRTRYPLLQAGLHQLFQGSALRMPRRVCTGRWDFSQDAVPVQHCSYAMFQQAHADVVGICQAIMSGWHVTALWTWPNIQLYLYGNAYFDGDFLK